MKILFFDTETTGLPKNFKLDYTHKGNWPEMIQIAWVFYNNGKEVSCNDYIIEPFGFEIPEEASKIHRITTEIAKKEGFNLDHVLKKFYNDTAMSELLIAHNIDFDKNVVASSLHNRGHEKQADYFIRLSKMFCTMKSTVDYCKLPGKYGHKWPKLEELYKILFDETFEGAHDALVDIRATARCYFELKKLKVI